MSDIPTAASAPDVTDAMVDTFLEGQTIGLRREPAKRNEPARKHARGLLEKAFAVFATHSLAAPPPPANIGGDSPSAVVARPLEDWHEDIGAVMWWLFPVEEAPWVGGPGDSDWPGYHTHWTRLPAVPVPATPAEGGSDG